MDESNFIKCIGNNDRKLTLFEKDNKTIIRNLDPNNKDDYEILKNIGITFLRKPCNICSNRCPYYMKGGEEYMEPYYHYWGISAKTGKSTPSQFNLGEFVIKTEKKTEKKTQQEKSELEEKNKQLEEKNKQLEEKNKQLEETLEEETLEEEPQKGVFKKMYDYFFA